MLVTPETGLGLLCGIGLCVGLYLCERAWFNLQFTRRANIRQAQLDRKQKRLEDEEDRLQRMRDAMGLQLHTAGRMVTIADYQQALNEMADCTQVGVDLELIVYAGPKPVHLKPCPAELRT